MEAIPQAKLRFLPEPLKDVLLGLGASAFLVCLAGGFCVAGGWAHIFRQREALRQAQESQARNNLRGIVEALERYRAERGAYPPGDGSGSASLAAALAIPGSDGKPFLPRGMVPLKHDGHFVNPLWGDPPHNRFYYALVDGKPRLWAADREGRPDGINNWER